MNNSYNKIRLRNLDPEVLAALSGNSAAGMETMLKDYFNKHNDTVVESMIDESYTAAIKKYSDNNDNKIISSLENYRSYNTAIKETDLDSDLATKINSCVNKLKNFDDRFQTTDEDGNTITLTSLSQTVANLQTQVNSIEAGSDTTTLKKQVDINTADIAVLKNSIANVSDIDAKLKNYRDKDTKIGMSDLEQSLQNKLEVLGSASDEVRSLISAITVSSTWKDTDIVIAANGSYYIPTDTPGTANLKIYVLDTDANSRTYKKYINSEGVITVGLVFAATKEEDYGDGKTSSGDTTDSASGADKTDTTDSDVSTVADTDEEETTETIPAGIYLYNDANTEVTVKLLYMDLEISKDEDNEESAGGETSGPDTETDANKNESNA